MGYSIGVEAKGGGTLEGYINLTEPNEDANKNTVFLTIWHVLLTSDPKLPVACPERCTIGNHAKSQEKEKQKLGRTAGRLMKVRVQSILHRRKMTLLKFQ